MELTHYVKVVKKNKIKPKENKTPCKCPACLNNFHPKIKVFFPREVWHPHRTYDFLRGYLCTNCGYLMTNEQVEDNYGR